MIVRPLKKIGPVSLNQHVCRECFGRLLLEVCDDSSSAGPNTKQPTNATLGGTALEEFTPLATLATALVWCMVYRTSFENGWNPNILLVDMIFNMHVERHIAQIIS